MQDKEIRKILIKYLKQRHSEYRIYQEKSIGSSICDLMLVTDKLTGFEIKSDSDSYERLSKQVTDYNLFFDDNYIVIGKSHIKSIESHVPKHWGIIKVDSNGTELIREPLPNRSVQRLTQLRQLWRNELRQILLENNMPLFSKRGKLFISQKLVENVEFDLLGIQIANAFQCRDYSKYHVKDNTIKSENTPMGEKHESL